ncbi:MAG: hypothetical protein IPL71_21305 [Anaerolineales bacterium]|uniref:hypothetical protein n=1 Tax=Candidatus Villigracilis proximus TaxID=3140683 RepID=UPI0031349CBB|nr:hypothetical protein [Anaerolineales bacterium]
MSTLSVMKPIWNASAITFNPILLIGMRMKKTRNLKKYDHVGAAFMAALFMTALDMNISENKRQAQGAENKGKKIRNRARGRHKACPYV